MPKQWKSNGEEQKFLEELFEKKRNKRFDEAKRYTIILQFVSWIFGCGVSYAL